ncbi:MAG: hypothetical protein DRO88_04580 [Promethearchaeia archaeon]|nr:MAG: hypothetical protein DRO88_04580 [Candidatus Lokiarchaeia archaeon]
MSNDAKNLRGGDFQINDLLKYTWREIYMKSFKPTFTLESPKSSNCRKELKCIDQSKYKVFSLSEWHQARLKDGLILEQRFSIRLFGSFFNAESWELSRFILLNFSDLFNAPEYTKIYPSIKVALIFFPVSTIQFQTHQMFRMLHKYLHESDESVAVQIKERAINFAVLILQQRTMQFHLEREESWRKILHNKQIRFLSTQWENKFLFGGLASRYLSLITLFPQIWVGSRYFSGIPLNMDLEEFVYHHLIPYLLH